MTNTTPALALKTNTTPAVAPGAAPHERPLHDYLKEVSDHAGVRVGSALPLGTSQRETGANFAFFSRHATRVRLELFDHPDQPASRQIDLDPACNRTGDVWHVWVDGIRPGQLYAYRVDGPYMPGEGQRFNFARLLLDPFATAVSRLVNWDFGKALGYDPSAPERDLARSDADDSAAMPKCVFTHEHFNWRGDQPPRHPWSETVIYETHIRGFTVHSSSGVQNPGTYRGLMEKILYLKDLGVTAVELMPVLEFNHNGELSRIRRRASCSAITGDTIRWFSLHPKRPTAVRAVRDSKSSSSRKWSRHFTRRTSK